MCRSQGRAALQAGLKSRDQQHFRSNLLQVVWRIQLHCGARGGARGGEKRTYPTGRTPAGCRKVLPSDHAAAPRRTASSPATWQSAVEFNHSVSQVRESRCESVSRGAPSRFNQSAIQPVRDSTRPRFNSSRSTVLRQIGSRKSEVGSRESGVRENRRPPATSQLRVGVSAVGQTRQPRPELEATPSKPGCRNSNPLREQGKFVAATRQFGTQPPR
ncbi:hypothetical protein Q31a_54570 [Aureliella helgolandensis]|uniref:Uncharacterized protein n=1 Tax=Aureliella helgolandensis TaxID=2527968 RepID=A0A518GEQ1_9BACT|nr:hypothetical protein Q31a_54570 [Aureliella helgolandensis]